MGGDRIKRQGHKRSTQAKAGGGGSKRRAVMAAGVTASVVAGGLGAGAAEASAAKLFACYSTSSKALSYSKSHHCGPGSKLISWNKSGPKGAKGATGATGATGPQGAQGAAGTPGVAVGYADMEYSLSKDIPVDTSTVLASFTPAVSADYAVNGTAALNDDANYGVCWDVNQTSSRTPYNYFYNEYDAYQTVATGGILKGGPAKPIYEECYYYYYSGEAYDAALTGIPLGAQEVHTNGARAQNQFHHPSPSATKAP